MYVTVFGIPAHPLLVHATVVMVPLAALLVVLAALWPALRPRLGCAPLGASLLALVLVPLTTSTGEQLRDRVPRSDAIRHHAQMADGLLPFVALLAVAAAGLAVGYGQVQVPARLARGWAGARRAAMEGPVQGAGEPRPGAVSVLAARPLRTVGIAAAALAVLAAVGTVVQVVRIGDSGARAVWTGVSTQPLPGNRP